MSNWWLEVRRLHAAQRIRDSGLRLTVQRQLVLGVLDEAGGEHLSADDVYERIVGRQPSFQRSTAYRVLDQLCDAGLVRQGYVGGSVARFHVGDHHHHILCVRCGAVDDLSAADIAADARALAEPRGYAYVDAEVVIRAICAACHTTPASAAAEQP